MSGKIYKKKFYWNRSFDLVPRGLKIWVFLIKNFFFSKWWISDLIPKKSEKFEFRKNFFIIFLSVKNWPRKTKFWYFSPTHFPKNCQNKLKTILWAIYKKKSKFWKTYFFIGISVKFCNRATNVWKFWSHESKVMKHFLFFGHERF